MKCVFCNRPYSPSVGCCDAAAISFSLVVLQYHADCSCQEVKDAIAQLEARLDVHYRDIDAARLKKSLDEQKTRLGRE